MQHTPKDWSDYPDTSTPITAAELERVEWGIANAERLWVSPITAGSAWIGPMVIMAEAWQYVEQDRLYAYPVYYSTTFAVDSLGCSVRGTAAGGTGYLALYNSANGGMPGAPVAQGTVGLDSSGWKAAAFTAVTGLPRGWYFHASRWSARLDINGGYPAFPIASPTLENAVRADSFATRWFLSTGTSTGALPTNPAMGGQGGPMPYVGVRFA